MSRLEEAIRKLKELSEEERAEIAREMIRGVCKPEGKGETQAL